MPNDAKNGLPDFSRFYFDRVWLKAYPSFFSNLRDPDNFDKYREYMDTGIFEQMTERAFDLYRTLNLIKLGIRKKYSISDIPSHAGEIIRYGEGRFLNFEAVDSNRVRIHLPEGRSIKVSLNAIMSLRFISYMVIVRGSPHYEKGIYMELNPWLRFIVKPFLSDFIPPMIRIFYNPLIRAKVKLGLGDFGYEHQHDNYIDPDQVDLGKFIELNHKYAFDRELADRARMLWRVWFGREEDLRIKVTQVEYSYDSKIPKDRLIYAFHFLAGRAKTLKSDVKTDVEYQWVDAGIKYYVTVKKGIQVKLYTKAWTANTALNRVEFTFNVNKDLDQVTVDDVVRNENLLDIYFKVKKALMDENVVKMVKEMLKPIIRCRTDCDRHYEFWIDLLLTGQLKGSSYFRHVAEVYKRAGLIRIEKRGRYSVYVLNTTAITIRDIRKALMDFLGIEVIEPLKLPRSDNGQ